MGWFNVYVIPQQTDQTLLHAKSLFDKAPELHPPNLGIAWTGLAQFFYKASSVGIKGIPRIEAHEKQNREIIDLIEIIINTAVHLTAQVKAASVGRRSARRRQRINISLRTPAPASGVEMLIKTCSRPRRTVLLNPNDPDAQAVQRLAYRPNRLPGKALSACQTALRFNPNHEEANVCTGLAQMALGRNAEAFPYFDKAVRLNPYQRPFRLMFFQALAHLRAGQHEKAVNMARKAIASNPNERGGQFGLVM